MFNVQGAIRCHKIETQITVEAGFGRRDILKCIGATIGMVRTIPFFYLSLYLMHELYVALVFFVPCINRKLEEASPLNFWPALD